MISATTQKESTEKLNKALEEVFKSDRYKELLTVMSRFNNYSLNNSLMIMAQKPDATLVQGYNQWKKMGRSVKQGEKAIKILAPKIKKFKEDEIDARTKKPKLDENGNKKSKEVKKISGFTPVPVFDVSQTTGKEIKTVRDFINKDLQKEEHIGQLYTDFTTFINESTPYNAREDETKSGVGGYFRRDTNEIVVSNTEDLSQEGKFRVLIHEYAHAQLHNKDSAMKDLERGHKEAQAESVAYVVSNYYGLNTDDISVAYIATWTQDLDLARQSLTEIQGVSSNIIQDLDELQKEKINAFYKENSAEYDKAVSYLINRYNLPSEVFSKENKENWSFQLLNKQSNFIAAGNLEFSDKTMESYIRTNKNTLIPLTELGEKAKYDITNVLYEKNIRNPINDLKSISDLYEIKRDQTETKPKYLIALKEDNQVQLETKFDKKYEATRELSRIEISKGLQQDSMLNKVQKNEPKNYDINKERDFNYSNLNNHVAKYLHVAPPTKKVDTTITLDTPKDAVPVGWEIMKNKSIKNPDDLIHHVEKLKETPLNKNVIESLKNAEVKSQNELTNSLDQDEREIG